MGAFLLLSAITILTPGPDTALTIRNTLVGGRAAGIATSLGVASGQLVWAVGTAFGWVAILFAAGPLLQLIRYAGAIYLIYLGLLSLRFAFTGAVGNGVVSEMAGAQRSLTVQEAFRNGLLSNLGNPKMAIFFASLMPQFLPHDEDALAVGLGLGCLFAAMTFSWLGFYATVIDRLGVIVWRSRLRRLIEAVMGSALVGFGVSLIYSPGK